MMVGFGNYRAETLQQQDFPVQGLLGLEAKSQPEAVGIDGGVDAFLWTSPVTCLQGRAQDLVVSKMQC